MRLKDKVAIVTGGAQGIGAATARLFVREGARVLIADVNPQGAETAREIAGPNDVCRFRETDVGREEEIAAMIDEAVGTFGKLDVLVNNAYWSRNVPITELTQEDWAKTISVCLSATAFGAKYAVPHLAKQGRGAIVSIASVHGIQAAAGWAPYETVKGGLLSLVRELAVELGPQGIRVNAVSPGWILTEVTKPEISPDQQWYYSRNYPVRHLGEPDDVAHAALYLASDEARFVTGHNLVVDGGMTVWLGEDVITNLGHDLKEKQLDWERTLENK